MLDLLVSITLITLSIAEITMIVRLRPGSGIYRSVVFVRSRRLSRSDFVAGDIWKRAQAGSNATPNTEACMSQSIILLPSSLFFLTQSKLERTYQ